MNETQRTYQKLKSLIAKDFNSGKTPIKTSTSTSSGGSSQLSNVIAQFNAHQAADFVVAHPTGSPGVNQHRTYYSINFSIKGGTGVDESDNILIMLNTIGVAGGGVCVISATNYADPVLQIDKTISIYYDNIHVVFDPATRLSYGAEGGLRVMGSLDEFTRKLDGSALKLSAASTVNGSSQTILQLSAVDTTLMDAEALQISSVTN